MNLLGGLFKGFINGLIVSILFALVGVSLFVGTFPPTVSQLKQVLHQFQGLQSYKEQVLNQRHPPSAEDLPQALEQARRQQIAKVAASRGDRPANSYERYEQAVDQIGNEDQYENAGYDPRERPRRGYYGDEQGRPMANRNPGEAGEAPPIRVEMPKEWRDQMYTLRSEIFRLNQRVIELEKQKYQKR